MEGQVRFNRAGMAARTACGLLLGVAAAAAVPSSQVPRALNIVVLEGEGAIHNVREHNVHAPVVRIEDQDRRPIAEAAVTFALPTEGVSGRFGNGSTTITVTTDKQGTATAPGLHINGTTGKLLIYVNVFYRGQTARTTITQFNMVVPKKGS